MDVSKSIYEILSADHIYREVIDDMLFQNNTYR